jgi:hypothetical protein
MARRRRTGKKPVTENRSVTQRAQVSTTLAEAVAGRDVPDHELTVLGWSNIARRFDLDEPKNGPNVVYSIIKPMYGFIQGYSASTISAQDVSAATDVSVADPTTALYPITPFAGYFETDVWPILTALFSSGTGQRSTVTINEFVRYNAMLMLSYAICLTPVMINRLTFHYDWTKVFPFSDVVPTHLYQMAENWDASDVGLATTWLPIMKRFENKIAFPRMIAEIKRMLSPMLSVDLNGRLQVPLIAHPATEAGTTWATYVESYLDYIDVKLADAGSVIATFLPFPMKEMAPWDMPIAPVIDVDRDTGWWNSNVKNFSTFGDTGDPDFDDALIFYDASGATMVDSNIPFTRHAQLTWAELKMASLWRLIYHIADNTFYLMTMHKYENRIIIDDVFDYFEWDGTQILAASDGFRYIDFANSRFASKDVDFGVQKPGLQGAEVSREPIERMMRLETSYLSNLEILKLVTATMAGASLRELRYTIANLVYAGLKVGI